MYHDAICYVCGFLYGINIQLHARYFCIFVFCVFLSGELVYDEQIWFKFVHDFESVLVYSDQNLLYSLW